MQLNYQQRKFESSCPARTYQPTLVTYRDTRADHSIGHRYLDTHLDSAISSLSWTKKRVQATSVADTGMASPLRLIPLLFTPSPNFELTLPCTASTCILLCHQAIRSKPQISKDLSHLLSSGAASRFQNAPQCSGVEVRMAADRVRCHVRLTPHRFFVRQSSDFDCAIEVVLSRLILETFTQ